MMTDDVLFQQYERFLSFDEVNIDITESNVCGKDKVVSVIIPSYQSELTINIALKLIMKQSLHNLDIRVVR
jgi:hypothetical protein